MLQENYFILSLKKKPNKHLTMLSEMFSVLFCQIKGVILQLYKKWWLFLGTSVNSRVGGNEVTAAWKNPLHVSFTN